MGTGNACSGICTLGAVSHTLATRIVHWKPPGLADTLLQKTIIIGIYVAISTEVTKQVLVGRTCTYNTVPNLSVGANTESSCVDEAWVAGTGSAVPFGVKRTGLTEPVDDIVLEILAVTLLSDGVPH